MRSSPWTSRHQSDVRICCSNCGCCGDSGSNSGACDLGGVNNIPAAYCGRTSNGTRTHPGPAPLHDTPDPHSLQSSVHRSPSSAHATASSLPSAWFRLSTGRPPSVHWCTVPLLGNYSIFGSNSSVIPGSPCPFHDADRCAPIPCRDRAVTVFQRSNRKCPCRVYFPSNSRGFLDKLVFSAQFPCNRGLSF